jgi:hypothetical protein
MKRPKRSRHTRTMSLVIKNDENGVKMDENGAKMSENEAF